MKESRPITKADQFNAIRRALQRAIEKVRITQGQRDTIIRGSKDCSS